jgi:hypothetical protein
MVFIEYGPAFPHGSKMTEIKEKIGRIPEAKWQQLQLSR